MQAFAHYEFEPNKEIHKLIFDNDVNHNHTGSRDKQLRLIIRGFVPVTSALIIIAVMLVELLLFVPTINAQLLADSDASISLDIEYALIMGTYYYKNCRYDEAIEQYQNALDKMPDQLFVIEPKQAIAFWQIGETYEANGQVLKALGYYDLFLSYAGDAATATALDYVTH